MGLGRAWEKSNGMGWEWDNSWDGVEIRTVLPCHCLSRTNITGNEPALLNCNIIVRFLSFLIDNYRVVQNKLHKL